MPRIRIPKDIGECEIIIARAGNYAIWNRKSGKSKFMLPCKSLTHAEELLRKIQEKDHDGELWV